MTDSSHSTAEAAKEQASGLKDEAVSSGQHVAGTAADQAGAVIGTAKVQAKDLLGQAQGELRDQAGAQQKRVASGLRSVSDELGSMADASTSGGVAGDLVQQAASRVGSIASWLDDRDPGSLLADVRSYAARKPGTFIAVAAIAGVLAGRLTRSLAGNAHDEKADAATAPDTSVDVAPTYTTPAAPAFTTADAAPVYTGADPTPAYTDAAFTTADPAPSYTTADPTPAYTEAAPAYSEAAFTTADATPVGDQAPTPRTHNVDDEYGDSDALESLFDEPAQGDDYRGERS